MQKNRKCIAKVISKNNREYVVEAMYEENAITSLYGYDNLPTYSVTARSLFVESSSQLDKFESISEFVTIDGQAVNNFISDYMIKECINAIDNHKKMQAKTKLVELSKKLWEKDSNG